FALDKRVRSALEPGLLDNPYPSNGGASDHHDPILDAPNPGAPNLDSPNLGGPILHSRTPHTPAPMLPPARRIRTHTEHSPSGSSTGSRRDSHPRNHNRRPNIPRTSLATILRP